MCMAQMGKRGSEKSGGETCGKKISRSFAVISLEKTGSESGAVPTVTCFTSNTALATRICRLCYLDFGLSYLLKHAQVPQLSMGQVHK